MTFKPNAVSAGCLTFVIALSLVWGSPVEADVAVGSSIGVEVEETIPPTTMAPTTTTTPPTRATIPAPVAPTTSTTTVDVPTTQPLAEPSDNFLDEPLPQVQEAVTEAVREEIDKSIIGQAKAAAKVTQKFFKGVAAGTPVADMVRDVLPAPVATVVVPAVRTASTFAFPISLAFAVLAFLVLQQRIDSTDPKLAAAPMAHEDDTVKFL